jgi:hypothetical protein
MESELDLPSGDDRQQVILKFFAPVVLSAREELVVLIEDVHRFQIHLSISAKGLDQSGRLVLPIANRQLEDLLTDLWWEFSEDIAGLSFFC